MKVHSTTFHVTQLKMHFKWEEPSQVLKIQGAVSKLRNHRKVGAGLCVRRNHNYTFKKNFKIQKTDCKKKKKKNNKNITRKNT